MFWLDIYGLSDKKDSATIEKFLNEFTHRDQIEDRNGDVITILANETYNVNPENIPIGTTTNLIDIGIRNLNKGFCAYFNHGLKPGIASLLLKFTYDNKIIYGVSVDKSEKTRAREIGQQLITEFFVTDVSIEFENPPADNEPEFYQNKEKWKDTLTA